MVHKVDRKYAELMAIGLTDKAIEIKNKSQYVSDENERIRLIYEARKMEVLAEDLDRAFNGSPLTIVF